MRVTLQVNSQVTWKTASFEWSLGKERIMKQVLVMVHPALHGWCKGPSTQALSPGRLHGIRGKSKGGKMLHRVYGKPCQETHSVHSCSRSVLLEGGWETLRGQETHFGNQ